MSDLRRFLGLTGYFRRFIPDYADTALPLYGLLKSGAEWDFDEGCQRAFEKLKAELKSEAVLRLPDFTKPFRVYADASGTAVGAILMQTDEAAGQEYAVSYASKKLQGAELNYPITEKECLAVVWALKTFRSYLHGQRFDVFTDHHALKWLLSTKELTGRLSRWSMFLQEFDMTIHYRPGAAQGHVDALSRIEKAEASAFAGFTNVLFSTSVPAYESDVVTDGPLKTFVQHRRHMNGISRKTKNRVEREARQYEFADGKFYRVSDGRRLEVPEQERLKAFITMLR